MPQQEMFLVHGIRHSVFWHVSILKTLVSLNVLKCSSTELGNGFFELNEAQEQSARFDREIAYRQQHGLAAVIKDQLFLDALQAGLPDCSVGLDRLLMICQVVQPSNRSSLSPSLLPDR